MDAINENYSQNKCNSGHQLKWGGGALCFNQEILCTQCLKNYFIDNACILRWKCESCDTYFCQNCRKVAKLNKCPLKHDIPFIKGYISSNYTCDICFKKFSGTFDTWFDKICNLGFCVECLKED